MDKELSHQDVVAQAASTSGLKDPMFRLVVLIHHLLHLLIGDRATVNLFSKNRKLQKTVDAKELVVTNLFGCHGFEDCPHGMYIASST